MSPLLCRFSDAGMTRLSTRCGAGVRKAPMQEIAGSGAPAAPTLMKMDPGVLKKADPPVPPVWRAPTVPAIDLLVANQGRVMVPCQDRSRRRRWPKASLYKGPSPGHARTPRAPFGCIAYVSYCKTTIRQVAL